LAMIGVDWLEQGSGRYSNANLCAMLEALRSKLYRDGKFQHFLSLRYVFGLNPYFTKWWIPAKVTLG